jgi:hypothetical protein
MSGQITQVGGQISLNKITGLEVPYVGTSQTAYLAGWVAGQYWVNTNFTPPQIWGTPDGVITPAQVAATGSNRWLTLLTATPASAVLVSDLVEVSLSDYARAPVTFAAASAAYPSVSYNPAVVTWGPFAETMPTPAQWVALVSSASGTGGSLLFWWTLPEPVQAPPGQPVQIPVGNLTPGAGLILDQT